MIATILQVRSCVILLVMVLLFGPLTGQVSDTTQFSFIRYDKNGLAFPGGTKNYKAFYQKVHDLLLNGDGQVNLMHIGGSHVQAGVWTEGLQNSLHALLPAVNISRGLIFPYRAIGTTQPVDYSVAYGGKWIGCRNAERSKQCPLGVMGISATTRDSTAYIMMSARPESGEEFCFKRLKVFRESPPGDYSISFPNDSLAVVTEFEESGYTLVEFSHLMDTVWLQLTRLTSEPSSFTLYGLKLDSDQPGFCLDAIGNNGADLPAYIKCSLLEQQVAVVQPDLVILSVGINDAYTRYFDPNQYKNNYRALIAKIHAAAPQCAILFTTNNDSYYRRRYPNANGAKVQQAIFELAGESGAGVWDLYEVMGGSRSINQWVAAHLARTDRIHFTSGGYQLIGSLLSEALVNSFLEFNSLSEQGD